MYAVEISWHFACGAQSAKKKKKISKNLRVMSLSRDHEPVTQGNPDHVVSSYVQELFSFCIAVQAAS